MGLKGHTERAELEIDRFPVPQLLHPKHYISAFFKSDLNTAIAHPHISSSIMITINVCPCNLLHYSMSFFHILIWVTLLCGVGCGSFVLFFNEDISHADAFTALALFAVPVQKVVELMLDQCCLESWNSNLYFKWTVIVLMEMQALALFWVNVFVYLPGLSIALSLIQAKVVDAVHQLKNNAEEERRRRRQRQQQDDIFFQGMGVMIRTPRGA